MADLLLSSILKMILVQKSLLRYYGKVGLKIGIHFLKHSIDWKIALYQERF